ncbi:MAG: NADH-quinone oxidoreductase subunit A [Bacteroidota bacterium]|nr:NADH-quinone oxidoreductase subunit A [Bacteroidota bacterium]MDP4205439.1 NADH-quinone oxidoreductase subunit A [Bacteroidota bacterium]
MQTLVISTPQDYIPVAIQAVVALAFVVVVIIASNLLGPKRKTEEKLKNFECGIEQVGNARRPYSVKYFLIAILFVLFDVEVIFMYPWAVNFRTLGAFGFWEMMVFTIILLAGFLYVLLKGAFNWQKREE